MVGHSPFFLFIFSFFLFLLAFANAGKQPPRQYSLSRKEKTSHLRFFFHDKLGGSNATAVQVAAASGSSKSPTAFGMVMVMDDPLTEGPEPTSKLVGRAQGLYAGASQETVGLLMAMSFAFMDGKYNGSTLSVLGRNTVFSDVREMPVVGGSGLFRFATGYAQAQTHLFDVKGGVAIVEYNVYVMHY